MHLSSQHQWQGAANLDDICASEGAQASKAGHCQVGLGLHQCLNFGEFKKREKEKKPLSGWSGPPAVAAASLGGERGGAAVVMIGVLGRCMARASAARTSNSKSPSVLMPRAAHSTSNVTESNLRTWCSV